MARRITEGSIRQERYLMLRQFHTDNIENLQTAADEINKGRPEKLLVRVNSADDADNTAAELHVSLERKTLVRGTVGYPRVEVNCKLASPTVTVSVLCNADLTGEAQHILHGPLEIPATPDSINKTVRLLAKAFAL